MQPGCLFPTSHAYAYAVEIQFLDMCGIHIGDSEYWIF
jgi:hypothetical protein